jgi:Tfp pilus assembly protein PilF
MKRVAVIAWVAGALLFAGCAAGPEGSMATVPLQLFDDSSFGAPTHLIDAAQVFAVSPQMKRYLEIEIAPQIRRQGRQMGLVNALYSEAHLRLDFDSESTRTAAEAFDARAGNCLSLVVMTAALAKELHLPVTYQALVGHELWRRDGDLNLAIGHVNILVAKRLVDQVQGLDADAQLQLSFGAPLHDRGLLMRPVREQTIVAMFMNNRAAEWLSRGDPANAYAHAREAVVQDPRYAGAYNTLGVIYQRRGLAARAAQAFGLALELDANSRPALANLAGLFESQRRDAEAKALRARLALLEAETPFLHLDLGRAAALAGDFRSAREHLLREMKRDPDYHELHYWLAVALAGLGDAAGAREHLATAMKNSTTRREHAIYAGKLERLQAATRAN